MTLERKGTGGDVYGKDSMTASITTESVMSQHLKRQSYFEKLGIDNGSQVSHDENGDTRLKRSNSNSNLRMSGVNSNMIMSKIQIGSLTNDSIV